MCTSSSGSSTSKLPWGRNDVAMCGAWEACTCVKEKQVTQTHDKNNTTNDHTKKTPVVDAN